jgi:nitrogen fixation/metabolism regulation signal transduction histidine kinase
MTALMDYSQSPIVKKLEDKNISSGVLEYNFEKKNYLGAFSKTTFAGVTAVSQVESGKAFMAVQHLVRRSLIFALIVSTITFIATVFFSRTLTQPLLNLVEAMQKVSEGQLDAVLKVKSQNRDEIAVLSQSFNKMTVDLKSSREQLEEINKELENKVLDRTKKLEEQNRAVKEAQEALLRTTRLASVGEIAGRTAHEVLNPLTSIMARVNKVQKRLNDQVAQDKNLLGEILNAWKSEIKDKGFDGLLKSLKEPSQILPGQTLLEEDLKNVNEIFSRWDSDLKNLENDTAFLMQQAGRIEKILTSMRSLSHIGGSKGHYNAHQILHDSVNIVSDLFSRTRTKIEEKFNATQDDIWVDRDELIQVMGNILKNSLHAVVEAKTPTGFVSIETKTEGEKFCIDFIDNGIGIKSENKNKLFESNFSTKTPEVGTGLGLSISRRFIRAFHGDLFLVKSEAHKETVFRIELPLYKKNREEMAA